MKGLERYLAPLMRRVRLSIAQALVDGVDDSGRLQRLRLRLLAGEVADAVPRYVPYGLVSVPLPGASAVVVCMGGNRNQPVAVAVDDGRHRPRNLVPGEAGLYTDEGDFILLRRGRVIEVVAGQSLRVTAPEVRIDGDLTVTGSIQASGSVVSGADVSDSAGTLAALRAAHNGHRHGSTPLPDLSA